MASIKAIRNQLAADVKAAVNTGPSDAWNVQPYPRSAPVPPFIEIGQFGITKHAAMQNGAEWWRCVIRAYVALAQDDGSQMRADELLENDPISTKVEADRTLNGNIDDLIVDSIDTGFFSRQDGQALYVGVEWQLRLLI